LNPGKLDKDLLILRRTSEQKLLQRLEHAYQNGITSNGVSLEPNPEEELSRLRNNFEDLKWFEPYWKLEERDELVVSRKALDQFKSLIRDGEALPVSSQPTNIQIDEKTMAPEAGSEPLIQSQNPNESDRLRALRLASQRFWARADRDDKSTHPKNADVEEWLMNTPYNFKERLASAGATIIRPKWAALGRPSEE
jgi:hypothetical protein